MAALETAIILVGGLGLGAAHALEVDHMTAVGVFVSKRPSPKQAVLFGVNWALGHGLSLLIFGSILFGLKLALSDSMSHWLERLVGVALLVVGLITLRRQNHHHQHHHGSSFWMGMLHGLAGTAAFVGESIVSMSNSYALVLGFTLAFSIGVCLSMAAFAGALGGLLSWSARYHDAVLRVGRVSMGLWSCAVGMTWILR